MIGKTLDGKYQIARLLGSGGMGSVYAAEDLRSGETVAVKIIHTNLAQGKALLQRFEREARAAGAIDTDHIARCFDAGTDPETGSPYMVLEYLIGEDLHHALKRLGPLPPDVALRILAQACMGVAKAHEAGVVHRDIKPANIFLAKGESDVRKVKVLDFGVAKIRHDPGDMMAESTSGALTRTGSILGSPLYMSPEQARSVKHVDHRSDIWSLGVVLYQSVAGRTPFDHISGLGDLILALCSDLPPPVQQFAPWVSPHIAQIIDQALRIDPEERFQTATEMQRAVCELLPDGIELRDEMLVALDDGTQENIAPSYFRRPVTMPLGRRMVPSEAFGATMLPSPLSASSPSSPSSDRAKASPARLPADSQASDEPSAPHSTQTSVATTGSGQRHTTGGRDPAPPVQRHVSTIALAFACVVAGGAGVYAFTRPTGAPVAQVVLTGASAAPAAVTKVDTPSLPAVPTVAAAIDAGADVAGPAPPPAPTLDASRDASRPAPVAHPHFGTVGQGAAAAASSASKGAPVIDYSTFGGRK